MSLPFQRFKITALKCGANETAHPSTPQPQPNDTQDRFRDNAQVHL
ncbi:MAG: hypothetical protein QOH41_4511 [Blastocatellia bacterium]|nr:hypothetical protein [Blastocatellia bacterium]